MIPKNEHTTTIKDSGFEGELQLSVNGDASFSQGAVQDAHTCLLRSAATQ
jgi:hypothetical protein